MHSEQNSKPYSIAKYEKWFCKEKGWNEWDMYIIYFSKILGSKSNNSSERL